MKQRDKIYKKVNDGFSDCICKAFKEEFSLEIETKVNIFSMCLSSARKDGKKLTKRQYGFISTFELGYGAAMAIAGSL